MITNERLFASREVDIIPPMGDFKRREVQLLSTSGLFVILLPKKANLFFLWTVNPSNQVDQKDAKWQESADPIKRPKPFITISPATPFLKPMPGLVNTPSIVLTVITQGV